MPIGAPPDFELRDAFIRSTLDSTGATAPVAMTVDGAPWSHASSADHPALITRCDTTVYDDFAAVEWVPWLINDDKSDSPLIEDWLSLDAVIATAGEVVLHGGNGSFATIDDFAPWSTPLTAQSGIDLSPGGGRSSSEVLPFFTLAGKNQTVVLAIGWTGEWRLQMAAEPHGIRTRVGIDRTRFVLHAGERVRGPRVLILFCTPQTGLDPHNVLRRFLRAHHRPATSHGPVTPALSAATWGATPDAVHHAVLDQIEQEKIPFERYWIDAGWFGGTGEWWANVGSWQPNPEIWPQGLRPISDHVHSTGRRLALWFEPERVCLTSEWHSQHPKWMLHVPDDLIVERVESRDDPRWVEHESRRTEIQGGEGLFNLADDDARQFLIDYISARIDDWAIDVYRHDFNFAPLSFWRANDTADRIGITQLKYVAGLYDFFDELARRHPNVEFDNCASGGRRLDLEMVGRATALSRSDYVIDPIGHQCHTYALAAWIPLHATLPHTGFDRFDVLSAMTSGLSLSWASDFNRPEAALMALDFAELRAALDEFREVREHFLDDFYPLTPYSTSTHDWLAYQFHTDADQAGIALVFRRADCTDTSFTLKLLALVPTVAYIVTIDGADRDMASGAELASGLQIDIVACPGAALVRYRPVGSSDDRGDT